VARKYPRQVNREPVTMEPDGSGGRIWPSMSIVKFSLEKGEVDASGIRGNPDEVEHYAYTLIKLCRLMRKSG